MNKIEEAVASLGDIMSSSRVNMIEHMSRNGKGELFILKYLYDKDTNGTDVIPSEISNVMHVSTTRISAALGALEKKGQVHREIDTNNRRNILVTITEEGRKRTVSEMKKIQEQMVNVFTQMGEHEAVEFIRLLNLLFNTVDKMYVNNEFDI